MFLEIKFILEPFTGYRFICILKGQHVELPQGKQKCIKGVHSENTSRNLKCTLSIHFTTERCCERCGKTYLKVYSNCTLTVTLLLHLAH